MTPWLIPGALALVFYALRSNRDAPAPAPAPPAPPSEEPGRDVPGRRRADLPPDEPRRRRGGGGGGGRQVDPAGLPTDDPQYVTRERVRAAEQGAVSLATDAQRTGTGQPSSSTILAVQRAVRLPASGQMDTNFRRGLAQLIAGRNAQTVSPPRDARHRAARMVAAAFLLPDQALRDEAGRATLQRHQTTLGVPPTGQLDQPTGIATMTELARD